jgi:DNA-binding response OmpR family regulator
LLITDVGLPGGMDGRQMAEAARQSRPDLKVLFITGYAEKAAIGNGRLVPGMHVLTKPFAMGKLASRITTIIDQSRAASLHSLHHRSSATCGSPELNSRSGWCKGLSL